MSHDYENCPSPKDHCLSHDEDEKVTFTTFKVCFECFHVFQTLKELVDAEEIARDNWNQAPRNAWPVGVSVFATAEIKACPYCNHDW